MTQSTVHELQPTPRSKEKWLNPTKWKQLGGTILAAGVLAGVLLSTTDPGRELAANIKEQAFPTNPYELVDGTSPYIVQENDNLLRISERVGDVLEGDGTAIAINSHETAYRIAEANDREVGGIIKTGEVIELPADIANYPPGYFG